MVVRLSKNVFQHSHNSANIKRQSSDKFPSHMEFTTLLFRPNAVSVFLFTNEVTFSCKVFILLQKLQAELLTWVLLRNQKAYRAV